MPDSKTTLDQAIGHHRAGRLRAALAGYRQVLQDHPDHPDALHLAGVVLAQAGEPAEGIPLIEKACRLRPNEALYHANLGSVQLEAGRACGAAETLRYALTLNPTLCDAQLNLGLALHRLGQIEQATEEFKRALTLRPKHAPTHTNLAQLYVDRGDLAAADRHARFALAQEPGHAETYLVLASIARAQGHLELALDWCRRGRAVRPDHAGLVRTAGQLLQRLGRYQAAASAFKTVLTHNPSDAAALDGLGNALSALGTVNEAISAFDASLTVQPNNAGVVWNRSLALLADGRFREAWSGFEARLNRAEFTDRHDIAQIPFWRGQPCIGKTILLFAEQGVGDTIQFLRYASLVAVRGARVIVEVQPALVALVAGRARDFTVVGRGDPLPPIDFQCPLMSLPGVFNTEPGSIPAPVPYLWADPSDCAAWGLRLGPHAGRLRIGLIWAGNPDVTDDAVRSPGLAPLLPLLTIPGCEWYGLQVGAGRAALARGVPPNLIDLGAELRNWRDTAAVMLNLDLIVSSCTAPAHLAGALGRPVWILLSYAPDWRWLRGRSDTPWYPTARLFRQPEPGAWDRVVCDIQTALLAGNALAAS